MIEQPQNRKETGRNPDGTFKAGFTGNPGGRPRNPLKEFQRKEFANWSIKEKKAFLKKVKEIDRWRMAEGNPDDNLSLKGEVITKVISIDE